MELLAKMEKARGEPIADNDPWGQASYRLIPAPVRPVRHRVDVLWADLLGWDGFSSG